MNSSYLGKVFHWLIKPLSFVIKTRELLTKFFGYKSINSIFSFSQKSSNAKTSKPILWVVILASLLLTGCVQYDVGVNFSNSNHGELVQHIKLGEKLTSFSGDYVYEWLNSIERRARKLEGKAKRISPEEVIVTIPFTNGQELQAKFNEFFSSHINQNTEPVAAESDSELPKVESNLLIEENNFLLLVRDRVIYDLDLRSLSLIASDGNVLANAGSILDLNFSLKTPLGAQNIPIGENPIEPEKINNQLVWKLRTGELNHIEVVFWLPSPLGIGALLIALFVWGGIYLRYTFMPDPRLQFAPKPAVSE
ncbi:MULTISPECIES: DUF3153 domain-containing protein [unclassified Tolypothrix]|uniref:DUF3153 domain-containing protein n=1 Tax=unclassified Tolypothrix TaxID=2649714 RepID=UPI0005EAB565|nr:MULTISPECIES: DUF3153 domain-containing protein [unclassified Tolypothrix]BAY94337.1 hypothetical protein NIES3275_63840 [Microchaete diplosiphon NIES-3275]EKF04082.1 hypothetical protein FDUTEX481_02909 [Tolypothrix sp. PCC 7601]MBE9086233.1 DUF3153 domain-containing protein [Tolypothrix sp. LEGE 11397]UYD28065.1 DUF3153 domain-containing protein [Tolypothrix sp. PCC 7712]UYD36065.1 DUF3153 domain-containing protein [Tolypothrix sp. PCC 7601]